MIQTDYLIVGSGISGLALSAELKKKGHSHLVVEVQSQPGGRIQSRYDFGPSVEYGAARILSSQKRALSLCHDLKIELLEQEDYDAGLFWKNVYFESLDVFAAQYLGEQTIDPMTLLSELCASEGISGPAGFEALAPKSWDSILFRDWLVNHGLSIEKLRFHFLGDIDTHLDQISLYEAAYFYCHNLADENRRIYRVSHGMTSLVSALIEKYDLEIDYNVEVLEVKKIDGLFQIFTNKQTYEAKHVIFTTSLSALSRIKMPIMAAEQLAVYLKSGHYGKSIKGCMKLKVETAAKFPKYVMTDDPMRLTQYSPSVFEVYFPVLNASWTPESIKIKLERYFEADSIENLEFRHYDHAPFHGCYWIYRFGHFSKIFEFSKSGRLDTGLYSVGEHFSLNPNWIEGSLESVENFIINELNQKDLMPC